ncbi:serine hydrolase domain-containing protein [Bacillus licheniformis]|jgi:CubicO group peptidase (beta-lactamase class C family)|uniref:Penicillin-binding protein n=2 Tax=Bacillus licheniformis TaxID=1402 RepID=Q65P64_BACLD|nr:MULTISPECIES: serine hydrolase domain-containing protein [Bacillus]MBY8348826.1 class A beta-lactamase-related serine hydrolase [Bacillus sp. PCH94]MDP4081965.1 serine hydrolase domain-containing protein [Bacillota bacterium]AAU21805.1 penicillin-binding protein [Bacillus licheniformis DSM 13 = ATCC 14580]AAU39150.1 putative penicillin-binding protein PbpX [Bacillus licheniformis DSM 13 = ATCC 14580]AKQ71299.1 penicillin-binding protein [Bacillus licheniformis WX-02]
MARTYRTRIKKRKKQKTKRRLIIFSFLVVCGLIYLALPSGMRDHQENQLQATEKKAQPEAKKKPTQNETKKSKIVTKNDNAQLDQYLKSIGFSGTALIVEDGKVVTSKGYLYANREEMVPNTPDTVFYVGSSQKAIIATAILQLEEKGLLSVNDPVSKYLPNFPNGSKITLYHFLTHTSGIRGHKEGRGYISPEDLIKDIEKRGVKYPTGKWDYRDSNYSVLAYIVSMVSGEPVDQYIKKHIFKPAGMKHAGFYKTFAKESNPSTGYKLNLQKKLYTPDMPDLSQLYGAGDIYMTAYDMYLFDKALYERKIISNESFMKMFTPNKATYGMGFYVSPGSYSSHGVMPGYNILNSFSLTGSRYVILFSNIQNNIKSFGSVNNRIFSILNGF